VKCPARCAGEQANGNLKGYAKSVTAPGKQPVRSALALVKQHASVVAEAGITSGSMVIDLIVGYVPVEDK
jgi:hypothetical protein